MKSKVLIPFLILLTSGVVLATQVSISWWDVYYKYAQVRVERYRIGMETLISLANEEGRNSSELSTIKGEFLAANEKLKTACDKEDTAAIETTISEMRGIVVRFKNEAKVQLKGLGKEALNALNDAWEENESYLNSLLDEARNLHKARNTEIFDWAVERGEDGIDKLKEYEKDVTQAEAKLQEIKGRRKSFVNSMEEAITACYGVEQKSLSCPISANTLAGNCFKEVQDYCDLRDEIRNDFYQLRDLIYEAAGLK